MSRVDDSDVNKVIVEIKGHTVLVDAEDDHFLSDGRKWGVYPRGKIFYVQRHGLTTGGTEFLHRVVMNAQAGQIVDHINGDGCDNRRTNLRLVTRGWNAANSRPREGTSIFKGVHWHKHNEKWQALLMVDGKRKYIGMFNTEIEAAMAYDIVAYARLGEYARLNFPELLTMFKD